jgi:hypothetical protein
MKHCNIPKEALDLMFFGIEGMEPAKELPFVFTAPSHLELSKDLDLQNLPDSSYEAFC